MAHILLQSDHFYVCLGEHTITVNYKMATYLCKRFLRDPNADGDLLLHEIAKFVEPVRPDRSDERKIQPKSFRGFVYRVPA